MPMSGVHHSIQADGLQRAAELFRWTRRQTMQILIKAVLSVAIILIATAVGKKLPSTAGLIGVMPLTGALVLVWMSVENKGNPSIMQDFTKGALWGILPSILFFVVALFCFKKHCSVLQMLSEFHSQAEENPPQQTVSLGISMSHNHCWTSHNLFATISLSFVVPDYGHEGYCGNSRKTTWKSNCARVER